MQSKQKHIKTKMTTAHTLDDGYLSRYDDLINGAIERSHIPGVSIAVTDGKDTWSKVRSPKPDQQCRHLILTAKGYGVSKFPNEPVTSKILFNAASMTKAFTAAAVSFLVYDGKYPQLKWTVPVSSIIPDFVLSDNHATALVSVEDILSNRSGLPEYVTLALDRFKLTLPKSGPGSPRCWRQNTRYSEINHAQAAPSSSFLSATDRISVL